jgi:hypothetical protein
MQKKTKKFSRSHFVMHILYKYIHAQIISKIEFIFQLIQIIQLLKQ